MLTLSRTSLSIGMLACATLFSMPTWAQSKSPKKQFEAPYISCRPAPKDRCFTSTVIDAKIQEVSAAITNPKLSWMFSNCYPNTLDTTVDYEVIDGKPDSYVITGDIDAMWLRDSSAQIWPYLSMVHEDDALKNLFQGLINRQMKCILLDPYANAFMKDFNQETHWKTDKPTPQPGVHERKYEIDSYCYPVRLSYYYWKETGDTSIFDKQWEKGARQIVETFRTEQRKDGTTPYKFIRKTDNRNVNCAFYGKGRPVKPVGLIASAFRPSDDGCLYPFLIPSNIFAVESLDQLSEIFAEVLKDEKFSVECAEFATEVAQAIEKYAVIDHLDYGKVYAYEVDGYGNALFTDDPNIPSLIAVKYLVQPRHFNEEVYQNTRKFLLSTDNPYYFVGKAGEGQGGPHAGLNTIWPMGIILRAMTSDNDEEIVWCVRQLLATDDNRGFMHETFHKDDASKFSRSWFAWANTLFGELIVKIYNEKPELLKQI